LTSIKEVKSSFIGKNNLFYSRLPNNLRPKRADSVLALLIISENHLRCQAAKRFIGETTIGYYPGSKILGNRDKVKDFNRSGTVTTLIPLDSG
jgi:hypothetical protein